MYYHTLYVSEMSWVVFEIPLYDALVVSLETISQPTSSVHNKIIKYKYKLEQQKTWTTKQENYYNVLKQNQIKLKPD